MYDKITSLVHAAREVFRPLHNEDDDMIYLPGEGARLVNAATACVSGAGRCVAKARVLLEEIGDFELELRCESTGETSPFVTAAMSPSKSAFESMLSDSADTSRRPSVAHINTAFELEAKEVKSVRGIFEVGGGRRWTENRPMVVWMFAASSPI